MSYYENKSRRISSYEPGMNISYDPSTSVVSVEFRGLSFQTEDLLKNGTAMITVAEDFCRVKGWSG
jgi:hypothetical protein